MAFKNYDELKGFLDGQARGGLMPTAGMAGKPLDGKRLAALQQAQLEAARDALQRAEHDRRQALEWHDAELARAKSRVDAIEQALKASTKPGAPAKKARKSPA